MKSSPLFAFAVGALGIFTFSLMDAVMKGLALALGTYNALFWRFLAALVISGVIWALRKPVWPSRAVMKVHVVRSVLGALMAFLFFWGLARVPMAQAIALTYIAPLLSLFLAGLLLGERIGPRTVLASLVAFAGVVVIMIVQARSNLGDEALIGAAAILASAVCYAWNIILMRQQAQVAGPAEIAFFQSAVVALVFLLAAPWYAVVPDVKHVPAILLGAALAVTSLFLLSWAYARGEASYLAPTEYTSFLWAMALGYLVFGEHVSLFTVGGAALIIGGCIWGARRKTGTADTEAALP
ncbi:DMT family transporter [Sphingomonas sp. LB-2]|nr:DMT family transporter [Sphingomonas caeni]